MDFISLSVPRSVNYTGTLSQFPFSAEGERRSGRHYVAIHHESIKDPIDEKYTDSLTLIPISKSHEEHFVDHNLLSLQDPIKELFAVIDWHDSRINQTDLYMERSRMLKPYMKSHKGNIFHHLHNLSAILRAIISFGIVALSFYSISLQTQTNAYLDPYSMAFFGKLVAPNQERKRLSSIKLLAFDNKEILKQFDLTLVGRVLNLEAQAHWVRALMGFLPTVL